MITSNIYTVGQFKDDCLQKHTHETSLAYGTDSGDSACLFNRNVIRAISYTSSNNNGRTSIENVTRGKRKGVKYCIKVL